MGWGWFMMNEVAARPPFPDGSLRNLWSGQMVQRLQGRSQGWAVPVPGTPTPTLRSHNS